MSVRVVTGDGGIHTFAADRWTVDDKGNLVLLADDAVTEVATFNGPMWVSINLTEVEK